MKLAFFLFATFLLASCHKTTEAVSNTGANSNQFVQYTIRQGQQFCDRSSYQAIETAEMKYIVRFDSTAVYQSQQDVNQYDINKLFGFSDNSRDHHQFSARFGWRWSEAALRLFAYVYNDGIVSSKELGTVPIGPEISCSIKVAGDHYLFTMNGTTEEMPRTSTTEKGKGYLLYPYFGGDEVAPHEIHIWMKEVK